MPTRLWKCCLQTPRIEILITDINMPGMDGYGLAEAAKQIRKELNVILLSGRESEGMVSLLCESHFRKTTS